MLPKTRRLSRRDFLITKSHGQTHRFPHFSIVIYKHPIDPPPRLGGGSGEAGGGGTRYSVVTSAKLHKHAVVRNRFRRLIYNSLITKHRTPNTDIIIFPNRSMLNLSREEISLELNQALSKITPS